MLTLDKASFDQLLLVQGRTVVVKFHGAWCPDCRRIEAAYADFHAEYPHMAFGAVDIEQEIELARRYDVRGIPSLLVFRQGDLIDRLYSREAKTVQQVQEFITRHARPER